jgi:hypothetical protein
MIVLGTLEKHSKRFAMENLLEREANLPKARIFVAMEVGHRCALYLE